MLSDTTTSSDSTPVQTPNREAFWQQHVSQWRESGLSKMAYCQHHSLVYHQMVYWCSKSARKDDDMPKLKRSNDFVALSVVPTLASGYGLSIRLPNGLTIEGIDERSVSLVGKLIDQL